MIALHNLFTSRNSSVHTVMLFLRGLIAAIGLCFSAITAALSQDTTQLPVWVKQYSSVRPSSGLFIVAKDGKMGVINAKGRRLTKLEYDTIYDFREGMAIVGKGEREVNQFGKVLSDFTHGYINQRGKLVIPTKYEKVADFSEGLAHIIPSLREDVWFNKQGKIVIYSTHFPVAESFQGGLAYVQVAHLHQGFGLRSHYERTHNPFDVRGNYIDHSGRLLVPWMYDTIAPYYAGYLRPVRKNGKWGFIDSTTALVIPLQYDDIDVDSAFFWRDLRRVGVAGRYGFLNTQNGQINVPLQYDDTKPSQSHFVWVRQRSYWGCINQKGDEVIAFQYDDARPFKNGLSIVQSGKKWGVIDTAGRLCTPLLYNAIHAFHEGRAAVKFGDKFGFINQQGQQVIPPVHEQVSQFANRQAYAKRWGLFITLNPDGHWIRIRLQTSTFKWLALLASFVLLTIFLVWRRQKIYLQKSM